MTKLSDLRDKKAISDSEIVSIWLSKRGFEFYHESLKRMRAGIAEFEALADRADVRESPFKDLLYEIDVMAKAGEKILNEDNDPHERHLRGISYRQLRIYKTAAMRAIKAKEVDRDSLATKKDVPRALIETLDQEIKDLRDKTETGVFNGLNPAEIFIEPSGTSEALSQQSKPGTSNGRASEIKHTISIQNVLVFDDELRSRTLDLLNNAGDNNEKLDRVVREMSVVLEDRVRRISGLPHNVIGVDLMSKAFAPENGKVKFSDDANIQNGAQLLYMGFTKFFRNDVGHRLVAEFTKDRVLQLLALVDYLLYLLTQSEVTNLKAVDFNESGVPNK